MLKIISKLSKTHSICECTECGKQYKANHYDARKSRIGDKCIECKSPSNQELNQELIRKFYSYNPETGEFLHRIPTHQASAGDIPGYIGNHGYWVCSVGGTEYLIHRLIWLYMTGIMPDMVDHINHDKLDNRWVNLRKVNNTENTMNCSVSKNSTTKVNGVSFMKARGKYRAYIMVNRKQINLGLYTTMEEAAIARAKADKEYGFHENHGA